jgi:hypothetical protein
MKIDFNTEGVLQLLNYNFIANVKGIDTIQSNFSIPFAYF